jgi:hypothetical protein
MQDVLKRLYFKLRFGISMKRREVKTMLTTILKFESSKGENLIGTVDSDSVKEFQKLQKKIVQDLMKMGDDLLEGKIPMPVAGAKLDSQAVAIISMETMGTGDHSGWYSKTSQESRFDHQSTYDGFVNFCDSLLADILAKAGSGGHGHGKKK